jgi:hypothetical protein
VGIEYLLGDARHLCLSEQFDLVGAGYLLNYAATREDLLAMCRTIADPLKPGCRFVSVNDNPNQPPADFTLGRTYGFVKRADKELRDGTPIVWTFFLQQGPFSITNYQLSLAIHEAVFSQAGFPDVHWHKPRLMPRVLQHAGRHFGPPSWKIRRKYSLNV